MKKKTKLKFGIIAFLSTLITTVLTGASLYNSETDAKVLGLFFGAFGAGVLLSKIIIGFKQEKKY